MKKIDLIKLLKRIMFIVDIIAIIVILYSLIWVELDFTLTTLCWITLFVIFYDVSNNNLLN